MKQARLVLICPGLLYRFLRLVLDAVFGVLVLSLHRLGQSLMLQVAKKASVLKRRKSRNRMETPGTPQGDTPVQTVAGANNGPSRCESDSDVVFYMEEPRAGKWQFFSKSLLCKCQNRYCAIAFICIIHVFILNRFSNLHFLIKSENLLFVFLMCTIKRLIFLVL